MKLLLVTLSFIAKSNNNKEGEGLLKPSDCCHMGEGVRWGVMAKSSYNFVVAEKV